MKIIKMPWSLFLKSLLLLKTFITIGFFYGHKKIEIPKYRPIGRMRRVQLKTINALELKLNAETKTATHEDLLYLMALKTISSYRMGEDIEAKRNLEEVIKIAIDWRTKYKDNDPL